MEGLDKLQPGTGVSDADKYNYRVQLMCDMRDHRAKQILRNLNLDFDQTDNMLSEAQLREFLDAVNAAMPELSKIYNPDRMIEDAQTRALPQAGWAGDAPVLIIPGQEDQ